MKTFKAQKTYGKVSLRQGRNGRFDPLKTQHQNPSLPVVAVLKARLNGRVVAVNHSVSFLKGLVFDCNQKTALPVSRDSLDKICGDILEGATYAGIYWDRALYLENPPRLG